MIETICCLLERYSVRNDDVHIGLRRFSGEYEVTWKVIWSQEARLPFASLFSF